MFIRSFAPQQWQEIKETTVNKVCADLGLVVDFKRLWKHIPESVHYRGSCSVAMDISNFTCTLHEGLMHKTQPGLFLHSLLWE